MIREERLEIMNAEWRWYGELLRDKSENEASRQGHTEIVVLYV